MGARGVRRGKRLGQRERGAQERETKARWHGSTRYVRLLFVAHLPRNRVLPLCWPNLRNQAGYTHDPAICAGGRRAAAEFHPIRGVSYARWRRTRGSTVHHIFLLRIRLTTFLRTCSWQAEWWATGMFKSPAASRTSTSIVTSSASTTIDLSSRQSSSPAVNDAPHHAPRAPTALLLVRPWCAHALCCRRCSRAVCCKLPPLVALALRL
jgi:hypothetical protein